MNEFLRQNWFKLSLLVIIIVVIGDAFYWFQIRPAKIRKECRNSAKESVSRVWTVGVDNNEDEPRLYDIFYQNCIKGIYGLDK